MPDTQTTNRDRLYEPEVTHWEVDTGRSWRGQVQAACGLFVSARKITGDPTCPSCKRLCDEFNNLTIE